MHGSAKLCPVTNLNQTDPKKCEPLTRGVVWFSVVPGADLLDQRLVVLPIERHGAVDQRVQQHAQRPRVHLGAPVRPPVDDLRGGVQGAAAEGLQVIGAVVEVGQAEVCDLEDHNTARCVAVLQFSLLQRLKNHSPLIHH